MSNGKTSKFSQNFYLKLLKKHTPIGCTIVSIKLAFYVCSPQVTNKNILPLHFRQRKSQVLLLKSTSREWKEDDLHDGYAPRKKKMCACWPWGLRSTTPVSHVFFSDVLVIIKKKLSNLYNILLLDVSPPRVNRKVIPLERQNHQPREHRDNFDMMPPKYQQPWAGEDIFTGFSGCHTKYIIIIYWFLTLVFRLIFVDSINVFTAAK